MDASAQFDPDEYKATTRVQWDSAAEAWNHWGETLEAWLGPATERMFDLALLGPGSRVLDVAAGTGGQTIVAAKRVGPSGSVLATDISLETLLYAQAAAVSGGLTNVEILQADGESLEFSPTFDAAISRVGLIYFPDQDRALKGIRASLKSGARFATLTYSTPERNPFFSIPIEIIRRRANLPAPRPGQPGPFSLGQPGHLEQLMLRTGFADVVVEAVSAPIRMQRASDYLRFARESFGALHHLMAAMTEAERADTWLEIEQAMEKFEGPTGFEGPCELLVGAGTKP